MWTLTVSISELIIRGLLVYIFLLIVLRISGKRQLGQLAPIDLILLLVLSNSVQNAMNGGDNSFIGGIVSALTLVGAHYLVAFLSFRFKCMEWLVEGSPTVIVSNGIVNQKAMNSEFLTMKELESAMRENGIEDVSRIKKAVLENGGSISIIVKE